MSHALAARPRRSHAGRARRLRPLLVGTTAAAVLVPASVASAAPVDFGLTGTAEIKAVFTEAAPISGSLAGQLSSTGGFSGDLKLQQTTRVKFVDPSFLTVTGKVGFATASRATGSLADGVLTVRAKLRIKIVETSLVTAVPLPLGSACQTKQYSDVELKSAPGFDPAVGGALTASFATSDFNGCPGLNAIIGPFVAASANTLSVTVAPKG